MAATQGMHHDQHLI